MDKLHLKPRDGLVIPDPETGKDLPPWGGIVANTTYWRRVRKDGDVVNTTEAEIIAGAAAAQGLADKPARKPTNKE